MLLKVLAFFDQILAIPKKFKQNCEQKRNSKIQKLQKTLMLGKNRNPVNKRFTTAMKILALSSIFESL